MAAMIDQVILWIGAFDAVVVAVAGLAAVIMIFLDIEGKDRVIDRLAPSSMIIVLSSLASIIILGLARWIIG